MISVSVGVVVGSSVLPGSVSRPNNAAKSHDVMSAVMISMIAISVLFIAFLLFRFSFRVDWLFPSVKGKGAGLS